MKYEALGFFVGVKLFLLWLGSFFFVWFGFFGLVCWFFKKESGTFC